MSKSLRIGTRDSQLAVWQATWVQEQLLQHGVSSELVYIKSEGDLDTVTPLYALGVQGVFTKTLDAALLNDRIDLAVHSMKDVPTQLASGISQAAVLERASTKDVFVYKNESDPAMLGFQNGSWSTPQNDNPVFTIGTSSIRRIAQWLHRYPHHRVENLRGNVNTRLRKVEENPWNGAIFAAAGLDRIGLRPSKTLELDWMLPAPAQGAVMVVCRTGDDRAKEACAPLNHQHTEWCTAAERNFLSTLMGGCSTPISALAVMKNDRVSLRGSVVSPDGKEIIEIERESKNGEDPGILAAQEILSGKGRSIIEKFRKK